MRVIMMIFLTLTVMPILAQKQSAGILLPTSNALSTLEENAIDHYTLQLENDPFDVKALVYRSELYRSLGMSDRAQRDMNQALAINPYANIYTSKNFRQSLFSKRTFGYETDSTETTAFDKSYLLVGEYLDYLNGHKVKSDDLVTLELALTALFNSDYDDARLFLDMLDEEEKDFALYHDILGVLKVQSGDLMGAVNEFTTAIEKNPSFVIPYHNRAVAYKRLGKLDESEKDFSTALQLNAELAKTYFGKGNVLQLKGDAKGAMHQYKQASANDGNYMEADLNHAILLKATGEYLPAMIEVDQLIDEDPDVAAHYYVRGGLHFIYGEYTNAIHDFDTYLEYEADDAEVIYYRGLCKILAGGKTQGCNDIRESVAKGYDVKDALSLYFCD